MSGDYEIGYGKPPKKSQFKKGQSGNPKGRPKGSRNVKSYVKATLAIPVKVKDKDGHKTVTTTEALLLRRREQGLKGDPKAIDRLIDLGIQFDDDDAPDSTAKAVDPTDQAILDAWEEEVLKRHQIKSTPDEDPSDD